MPNNKKEDLKDSQEKYRTLFEMESDAIFLIEKNTGQILEANSAASTLYGYSKIDLTKMKNVDLSAEPDKTQKATHDKDVQIPVRYHKKKDGTVFPVEITANHLKWQGKDVHIAAIRDISHRMELEKERAVLQGQLSQARKMESLGTLAGGIAHEFNNILSIIIGNTELALDDVPEWSPVQHNLKEIKNSSMRAKDVVRQLLSFSRKTEHRKITIKLQTIIEETLTLLNATLPSNIQIHHDIPGGLRPIMADPAQIRQVLINLCMNGAHAMEEGGGLLTISVDDIELSSDMILRHQELIPGSYIKLTISDTGCGIHPQAIERIFDPYYTTKSVDKGIGMGLAMVHGIVRDHSGAVYVESEQGKGTIMTVLLPASEALVEKQHDAPQGVPFGTEHILVVDDEPSIVIMIKQILERLGYQVAVKTDSADALSLIRENPYMFDMILTDMTMPGMTGDKLASEILHIRPDMPIILCTGYNEKISIENAGKIGIRTYLEKPLNKEKLGEIVRKTLDSTY